MRLSLGFRSACRAAASQSQVCVCNVPTPRGGARAPGFDFRARARAGSGVLRCCLPCRRLAHHDLHEQAGQNRETEKKATGLAPWAPSPPSVSYGHGPWLLRVAHSRVQTGRRHTSTVFTRVLWCRRRVLWEKRLLIHLDDVRPEQDADSLAVKGLRYVRKQLKSSGGVSLHWD